MVKAKYIEFRCPRTHRKVFGKVVVKKIKNYIYVRGKGYYVSKDRSNYEEYIVFETDITNGEKNKYITGTSSWQVFKTTSKRNATAVAKYLAKKSEI